MKKVNQMKENFLKRFLRKWNVSLQKDKQQHFWLGFLSTFIPAILLGTLAVHPTYLFISCLVWMCLVGYGIEFAQSFTEDRHTESLDAYATVAGGVVSLIIWGCVYEIVSFLLF